VSRRGAPDREGVVVGRGAGAVPYENPGGGDKIGARGGIRGREGGSMKRIFSGNESAPSKPRGGGRYMGGSNNGRGGEGRGNGGQRKKVRTSGKEGKVDAPDPLHWNQIY